MDFDRIKHSYQVALKMQEIGKELGLKETELNELFILGLNHDIGYNFSSDNSEHNKIGGKILKSQNYKYWEEVYYHGETDINYQSLYLDILNLADMQIDWYGNCVDFEKRLIDISFRYGIDSETYKKGYMLVKELSQKYKVN